MPATSPPSTGTGIAEVGTAGTVCFHCRLPVTEPGRWSAIIDGEARPMCCAGCEAVANAIVSAGLDDYYRHRTAAAETPAAVPAGLEQFLLYDDPQLQAGFTRESGPGGEREASLAIEGMRCGACVWLLERSLASEPGVLEASVNFATERAVVRWDPERTRLSRLLARIQDIGYDAVPYDPERREASIRQTNRTMLRRLFVAGVGMMQVMMYALPAYVSTSDDLDYAFATLMRWISFALTTPVVTYSAAPFFAGAWRDLRARSPGMDVPVALGVGIAYVASAWATIRGQGEVYFDSVTMFVFLLLGARYLEWIARRRAGQALDVITGGMPEHAVRLGEDGAEETVPAARLMAGDRIRVDAGATIPVDACLREGRGAVDLALLTGESVPVPVSAGEEIPGGAVNAGAPLELEVLRTADHSTLSSIERLIERSAQEKPRLARLADRIAGVFVSALLVFTVLVLAVWLFLDPARAAPIAITVLVVSCPCALSLATPAALAASTGSLLRGRTLVTRGHALEALASVTDVVFDKTGTLTAGKPTVVAVQAADGIAPATALAWASLLETGSPHPFAQAIHAAAREHAPAPPGMRAQQRQDEPGFGVAASLVDDDGHRLDLRLGSAAWCGLDEADAERLRTAPPTRLAERTVEAASAGRPAPADTATAAGQADEASEVFLVLAGDEAAPSAPARALARIAIADPPRPEAAALVERLKAMGLRVHLLSGDRAGAVAAVARVLGIDDWQAQAHPARKLAAVQELRATGARVLMVGDGINDAPVLAAADVSVAVGQASALARTAADAIVLAPSIAAVGELLDTARRTRRVMKQNLGWAAAYNTTAIPIAAFGLVPPWAAAIGMALSSLAVALNALRLWRA